MLVFLKRFEKLKVMFLKGAIDSLPTFLSSEAAHQFQFQNGAIDSRPEKQLKKLSLNSLVLQKYPFFNIFVVNPR